MNGAGDLGSGLRAALPPLGDVLEFMRLIWAVDHGLPSAPKRMVVSLGVTAPQRLVIRIVGRFPGISAGQLAGILHVHPSTLTGVVKRLERRRLLGRRVDPRDHRRAALGLTERGRKVDATAGGTVEAAVEQLLSRLPRSSVLAAEQVLSTLATTLETRRTGTPPARSRRRRV